MATNDKTAQEGDSCSLTYCSHVLEQWKVLIIIGIVIIIIIGIVIIIFISPVVDGVDELRKATNDKTAQQGDSRSLTCFSHVSTVWKVNSLLIIIISPVVINKSHQHQC